MVSFIIDGVTQEVIPARKEIAVSNSVGSDRRQIRGCYKAEAGQATEIQ